MGLSMLRLNHFFHSFKGYVDKLFSSLKTIPRRKYLEVVGVLIGLLGMMWVATLVTPYQPKADSVFYVSTENDTSFLRARVESVDDKSLSVTILDGPLKDQARSVEYSPNKYVSEYSPKDLILVSESSSDSAISLIDRYRVPGLIVLVAIFMTLVLFIGRRRGVRSLTGLAVSIMVVAWFIIPLILSGYDALWISIAGAYMIAFSSIIIAHGLNYRTLISLGCILVVLTLVAIGASLTVYLLGFTGFSDETAFYLSNSQPNLDLGGILIGGIIIASLGVLDDIITTQVATVDEIFKANPKLSIKDLFSRASSVGGEHIASLVNTLALVYIGAALPIIILLANDNNANLLLLVNSEFFATEVIRTIIASIGLVLAVPFSTIVSAVIFHKTRSSR